MTNINRDPLLRVIYDAAQAIEACGASEALTAAVMAVTEIYQHAERVLDDRDALHAEFDGTRAELAQARAERDALRAKLRAIVEWLERNRPEVWREGMWDAIRAARAKEESDE